MPARRHRFPKCNHLGHGSICRRCLTADALDAKVKEHPNDKNAKTWTAEAVRLRAPAASGSRPKLAANRSHDPSEDLR